MADPSKEIAQGETCLRRLDYDGALKHFDAALKEDPQNAYAYFCKAEAALGLDRTEPDEIASLYKQAMELDPKNPQYLDAYGSFCMDTGRFKEGEEAFNMAARLDEENAPFYYVDFAVNYYRKAPIIMARFLDDTTRRMIAVKALDYLLKALGMDREDALEFLRD
ncbi:MAG: tetratricopeptide repeat protein [Thermoplasmata archaeon]